MTANIKANSRAEAWKRVDEIFPTDYEKDVCTSNRAGYPIYNSTVKDCFAWISDLGSRIEVNLPDGGTVNIWIEEKPKYTEYDIAEALRVINDAIYELDDKVCQKLKDETGLTEARNKLYGAYAIIARILKEQHPESKLYRMYNLQEA